MVFVQASLAISLAVFPLPVTGVPADAVKFVCVIFVIVYEATAGVLISLFNVRPVATSLQMVKVWLATTGSGLTVKVIVNGLPKHPVDVATGTAVY